MKTRSQYNFSAQSDMIFLVTEHYWVYMDKCRFAILEDCKIPYLFM